MGKGSTPKIGDIVWVNDGDDEVVPKPGIVVEVTDSPGDSNPILKAVIFSANGNPSSIRRGGLTYSATLEVADTWAWPPD